MIDWLRLASILTLLGSSLGCSICSNPFDSHFVTYGSRTPRQEMRYGRVGSPFSDPVLTGELPSKAVEVLDETYGDVLENADAGPIFMDEPGDEPALMPETP